MLNGLEIATLTLGAYAYLLYEDPDLNSKQAAAMIEGSTQFVLAEAQRLALARYVASSQPHNLLPCPF